ncbi:MAG: hypothetical protein MRJ65_02855 [Candidatus Brocadiaceae bacterium]|nr:hypothetical protein [Candidatus Brocadiaceae bacterium]
MAHGLECLIEKAEKGEIEYEEVDVYFNYVFYNTIATKIVHNNQTLMHFTGSEYEVLRNKFVEADKEIMELQQQKIAYMIKTLRVPPDGTRKGRMSQLTDMGLIDKEVSKKTRHIPIRSLVERAGNALLALKPCFMMSLSHNPNKENSRLQHALDWCKQRQEYNFKCDRTTL